MLCLERGSQSFIVFADGQMESDSPVRFEKRFCKSLTQRWTQRRSSHRCHGELPPAHRPPPVHCPRKPHPTDNANIDSDPPPSNIYPLRLLPVVLSNRLPVDPVAAHLRSRSHTVGTRPRSKVELACACNPILS